ncbi:hypothetical protein PAXINDRAFT_12169 [Paxillus involutus ATCC 200175]|uniref:Uncharacterized protein n=1 Tax=Paxillus involutus ATCC 200175 TaxID=664439 RepID=A0A0C9TX92_PAXIN|nr:hypothetical protein PAXINDRAFT_12169 [Paxillus involutus ATCC 200175]
MLRPEHLIDFVKKRKKEPIEDLSKITHNDYAKYMWQAIYPSFRRRLEAHLIAADPTKDMSIPFEVARIRRAAKGLLQRDQFDLDHMQSDSEGKDSEEEDTSSKSNLSDSTESDSSDDEESHRKSKYKKKKGKAVDTKKTKTKTKSKSKSKSEPLEEDTPSKESKKPVKKQHVPDNTVEELPEYNGHDNNTIMEDVDEGRKGTRPKTKGRGIDGGKKEKKEKEDKYIKKTRDSKREAPGSGD